MRTQKQILEDIKTLQEELASARVKEKTSEMVLSEINAKFTDCTFFRVDPTEIRAWVSEEGLLLTASYINEKWVYSFSISLKTDKIDDLDLAFSEIFNLCDAAQSLMNEALEKDGGYR